ncbi:hypothetical protein QBC45DRAFT_322462, partial [Copromyces sp. CBS 386.78]
ITLRNINLPPGYKEFSESFKGYKIISLFNLFFNYNQIPFEEISRDITTFSIPFNHFKITILL